MEQEGHWGTVCADGWNMKEVARVCWELNCGTADHKPAGMSYPPVAEKNQIVFIHLSLCNGIEEALDECEQFDLFDCRHDEDADTVREGG